MAMSDPQQGPRATEITCPLGCKHPVRPLPAAPRYTQTTVTVTHAGAGAPPLQVTWDQFKASKDTILGRHLSEAQVAETFKVGAAETGKRSKERGERGEPLRAWLALAKDGCRSSYSLACVPCSAEV